MKTAALVCLLLSAVLLAGQADAADAAQVAHGHDVFALWCEGCHHPDPARQANGGGLVGRVYAGTYTLQQRYQGREPAALEQRTDLSAAYIRTVVRNGLNVMPRSRKTEISDADLDAVIAYLTRNNSH